MLPKQHKLSRTTFPNRKEQKLSWGGKALRIYVYASKGVAMPRFAVVVPKNFSKGAVPRNLFKRRVLAMIKTNMKALSGLSDKRYVIFPKESLRATTFAGIKEDIQAFIKHAARLFPAVRIPHQ